jgi:hypothetical protein|tara:strand:- start:6190 stop:7419 length:1230 start_codon:yes stop_codon:yes gene_type:complete
MYDVFVGKNKSLTFPIMCNAHVVIPYAENIVDIEGTPNDTTDDIPYGIWSNVGSFTFQAIITPYDINGQPSDGLLGRPEANTTKGIMPANTGNISETYLPTASRFGHEMMLFYNDYFSISLLNTTTTNKNQPAEYAIKVVNYQSNGNNTSVITSPTVIQAATNRMYKRNTGLVSVANRLSGINEDGQIIYDDIGIANTQNYAGGQFNQGIDVLSHAGGATNFYIGQEIFIRAEDIVGPLNILDTINQGQFDYYSLGKIKTLNYFPSVWSYGIELDNLDNGVNAVSFNQGTSLYVKTFKEPKYIDNTHHIAVAYSETSRRISIYYNGALVKTGSRAQSMDSGKFSFSRSDFIIGKNTIADNDASTDKQFMGEIHELCVENTYKKNFNQLHALMPKFDNTLLYLQFEEADL